MSRKSCLQLPSQVLQVSRVVLLILWSVTILAAHWLAFFLYLVPLLALITFFLLPPFPLVLAGLFLSGYIDVFPADQIPGMLKLLLIGGIWFAALVALGANTAARRYRVIVTQPKPEKPLSDDETLSMSASSTSEPVSSVSSEVRRSPNLRHDVSTPLNLIVAFCEALLNPASAGRQQLSAPFREDVEAIYRNVQQLKPLIEQLLDNTASFRADEPAVDPMKLLPQKRVILLDENGAAFELFRQYLHQYEAIRVSSLEAIGQLPQNSNLLAVAISRDDYTLIPVVAQLVGNAIPILMFNLADAQPQTPFHGASDYLMKPVAFDALMSALERTGAALRSVLIIDDNRDNIQMLSRMLSSTPEPPDILKAYSGREALALLREELPDVILLDFVLPDMDGMAMLDYLHTEDRLARIPVLLVSAHRPPDILPVPGVIRLTLFQLAGLSPAHLARHIDALLAASNPQP